MSPILLWWLGCYVGFLNLKLDGLCFYLCWIQWLLYKPTNFISNAYKLDINVSSLAKKYYVLLTKTVWDLEINFNELPSCEKCLMIKQTKLNLITLNLIGIQMKLQHYLLKRQNSSLVGKGWNTKEQMFDELKQTLSKRGGK